MLKIKLIKLKLTYDIKIPKKHIYYLQEFKRNKNDHEMNYCTHATYLVKVKDQSNEMK